MAPTRTSTPLWIILLTPLFACLVAFFLYQTFASPPATKSAPKLKPEWYTLSTARGEIRKNYCLGTIDPYNHCFSLPGLIAPRFLVSAFAAGPFFMVLVFKFLKITGAIHISHLFGLHGTSLLAPWIWGALGLNALAALILLSPLRRNSFFSSYPVS